MNSQERISVVVAIYNIDQYVGYCIESLMKQTYENLEIILVDDGSTDRSGMLCDLYAGKDARIRVIHKENGGLVSGRKAGAAAATGAYIGYVDGDDWVEPDYYASLYRAAKKSAADIVCAGFSRDLFDQHVRCNNNILDGIYEGSSLEKLYGEMLSYEQSFQVGITTYVWNKLFKADLVREVQMRVDERITIGEDAAVTYPALLRAKRVYVCDNSFYHYRQREGSMLKLHGQFSDELAKIRFLYEFMKSQFEADPRREILLPQLEDFVLCNCIMRSGGITNEPFETKFEGKKVAIVQAGTFGQVIYERLKAAKYCDVAGWYDEDYWEYRRCCMNVDPLWKIAEKEFDYALIAKMDQLEAENIRGNLIRLGVAPERILSIDYGHLNREKLLRDYLA